MIIHPRNAPLQFLRKFSPNLDPMSYPLTHPFGQPGWHHGILLQHPVGGWHEISMIEFSAYRLAIRAGFNPVLQSFKLTQQYAVNQWVKIEHQRLQYLRENQRQLRVDWWSFHIIDASSRMNKSVAFISCPTWLLGTILQLLTSLHGTDTLKVEWMV